MQNKYFQKILCYILPMHNLHRFVYYLLFSITLSFDGVLVQITGRVEYGESACGEM